MVPIDVPSLRARREDIPDLAQHFFKRLAATYGKPPQALTARALEVLGRYDWPGNIRELENLTERLVVVCDAPEIDSEDLPLDLSMAADLAREIDPRESHASAMATFEKSYLRRVLQQNGWKRRPAAEQLGIGYSTLKGKLRAYSLGNESDDDS